MLVRGVYKYAEPSRIIHILTCVIFEETAQKSLWILKYSSDTHGPEEQGRKIFKRPMKSLRRDYVNVHFSKT